MDVEQKPLRRDLSDPFVGVSGRIVVLGDEVGPRDDVGEYYSPADDPANGAVQFGGYWVAVPTSQPEVVMIELEAWSAAPPAAVDDGEAVQAEGELEWVHGPVLQTEDGALSRTPDWRPEPGYVQRVRLRRRVRPSGDGVFPDAVTWTIAFWPAD